MIKKEGKKPDSKTIQHFCLQFPHKFTSYWKVRLLTEPGISLGVAAIKFSNYPFSCQHPPPIQWQVQTLPLLYAFLNQIVKCSFIRKFLLAGSIIVANAAFIFPTARTSIEVIIVFISYISLFFFFQLFFICLRVRTSFFPHHIRFTTGILTVIFIHIA